MGYKIVVSKNSGKRYLEMSADMLTAEEKRLVEASKAADQMAAAAAKAMRECILAREELQGKAFNQAYRTYGGGVKLGIGEQKAEPKAKATGPATLSEALEAFDADGIAR